MTEPHPSPLLPEELLWADGGHASDVVLTALADGEHAIVPESVRAHVERCAACSTHLGHAALLSLRAGAELRSVSELARRPVPKAAILAGLGLAILGLVPSLRTADASLSPTLGTLARLVAVVARRLGDPGSLAGLFVTYATALVLVATALAFVRRMPRKGTSS